MKEAKKKCGSTKDVVKVSNDSREIISGDNEDQYSQTRKCSKRSGRKG